MFTSLVSALSGKIIKQPALTYSTESGAEISPEYRLSNYLPYLSYSEENDIFINEESIGICLELMPNSGADSEMVNILHQIYTICPVGANLSFHLYADPHLRDLFANYASSRLGDDSQAEYIEDFEQRKYESGREVRHNNVFRSIARKRVEFLMKGTKESMIKGMPFLLKNYRLVFSLTLPGSLDDVSKVEELTRLRTNILSTFASAHLPGKTMNATDLINWVSNLSNADRLNNDTEPLEYDPNVLIRDQMIAIDTITKNQPREFLVSKHGTGDICAARNFLVTKFPSREWGLWEMGNMIGDFMSPSHQYPCPFMISLGVTINDDSKAKSVAAVKLVNSDREVKSPLGNILPGAKDRYADWTQVNEAYRNNERSVGLYLLVSIYGQASKLDEYDGNVRSIWKSRDFTIDSLAYIQRIGYFMGLPMYLSEKNVEDLRKLKLLRDQHSKVAAHLSPVVAEWSGGRSPMIILVGRRGQIVNIDLFENKVEGGNYNLAVTGASGSGKSVTINEVAYAYRSTGAQINIIDLGNSYLRQTKRVGGQYIRFSGSEKPCINMFSTINPDLGLEEDINILKPLICRMASPSGRLDDFQEAAIENAIKRVFDQYGNESSITPIYQLFKSGRVNPSDPSDQRILDLAHMLEQYAAGGIYADYFDGKCSIDFDSDFIVLETEELKRKPQLFSLMTMIQLYQITSSMYLNRHRRTLAIIDEAKDFLAGEGTNNNLMAKFIDEAYSRARKYNGSITTGTQSIMHYYASPAGRSALGNSDWLWILRQKRESIEAFSKENMIVMDDYTKRTLLSLRTVRHSHAEIFVRSPMGEGVGRLFLDPRSLLMYSNDEEANIPLDKRMAAGMSVEDAIEDVLRERGIQ